MEKGSKFDPSTQDLRQMYVYNDYWKSVHFMLLYPKSLVNQADEN